ncbi:unnamed protein product [Moneuplotes crassus]|uniref:Uncharacterized protein n=1 Tax=Euplotes crassus TaxID=5936 RepID=A0AAD1XEI5_EUPCR|nr:unnamed protein product [Moneuplotes crassus]
MEKQGSKKTKIDPPLILKSKLESGCKAASFIDQHTIVCSDGTGSLEVFNFEKSETLVTFKPSESKIILGVHISQELQHPELQQSYKLAIVLYKDGEIDVLVAMVDGIVDQEKWKKIYTVKSPLSFMMQVPKLEKMFSKYLLGFINEEGKESTDGILPDPISAVFSSISDIDKSNKKGAINVVEFSDRNFIFVGYESGTIIPCYYSVSTGKVLPLTKGFVLDPVDENPSIILSIFPIFQPEEHDFHLAISCYTQDISILSVKEIDSDLEEKCQMKRIKGSKEFCEISLVSVIKDAMFKPGTCEIKYYSHLLFIGSFDHRVRLYRVKKPHKPKLVGLLKHHKAAINSVSLYSNGSQCEVLVGSEDGSISLWTLNF